MIITWENKKTLEERHFEHSTPSTRDIMERLFYTAETAETL
jgi:hypothetical protein